MSGLFAALEREDFGRQIALGGHDLRSDALVERIAAIASVTSPRLRVPVELALLGALAVSSRGRRSTGAAPLPALTMVLLHESHPLGPGEHVRSLDTTIRDSLAWWRGGPRV